MKALGILGAGNIGKAVAAHLLNSDIEVLISNSKGPDTLSDTISGLGEGAKAVTAEEAAAADVVLIAVPWPKVRNLTQITDWEGKIVIDATNHFKQGGGVEDLGGLASSEVVQNYLPGAKIVKAFNTLTSDALAKDPEEGGGKRVLFISGDDKEATDTVRDIISKIGFMPVNLGTISTGSKLQQAGGPLNNQNLIKL